MRAIKRIQMISKGVTALADFCVCMTFLHRGLHHKTFQGHLETFVQACETTACTSEAASAHIIKDLYADFLNSVGNTDVIFDESWMARGHSSVLHQYGLHRLHCRALHWPRNWPYCVLKLVLYVLSNHSHKKKITVAGLWPTSASETDCSSGRMKVETALTAFQSSLAKHGLRYTAVLSDGGSRTFYALSKAEVYEFVEIDKKDCINHVQKRAGTALQNLIDKKRDQGESLGGRGKLTQEKIKIINHYGYALRSNSNNARGMKKAMEATLLHNIHRQCQQLNTVTQRRQRLVQVQQRLGQWWTSASTQECPPGLCLNCSGTSVYKTQWQRLVSMVQRRKNAVRQWMSALHQLYPNSEE